MTDLEELEQWWGSVAGGPLPSRQRIVDLVYTGGMDCGTAAFLVQRYDALGLNP